MAKTLHLPLLFQGKGKYDDSRESKEVTLPAVASSSASSGSSAPALQGDPLDLLVAQLFSSQVIE